MSERFPSLETNNVPNHEQETPTENRRVQELLTQGNEWLTAIDEEVLFSVMHEYLKKSGVEIDKKQLLPKNSVRLIYDLAHIGGTSSKGSIDINMAYVQDSFMSLLYIYVHEQLHQLTYVTHPTTESRLEQHVGRLDLTTNIGLERISRSIVAGERDDGELEILSDEQVRSFTLLNEGFTTQLTNEICIAYCTQTGQSKSLQETPLTIRNAYPEGTLYVDVLILFLHHLTSIPADTIRNAFTHTYFTNGEILPDELLSELQSINIFQDAKPEIIRRILTQRFDTADPETIFNTFLLLSDALPETQRSVFLDELQTGPFTIYNQTLITQLEQGGLE